MERFIAIHIDRRDAEKNEVECFTVTRGMTLPYSIEYRFSLTIGRREWVDGNTVCVEYSYSYKDNRNEMEAQIEELEEYLPEGKLDYAFELHERAERHEDKRKLYLKN